MPIAASNTDYAVFLTCRGASNRGLSGSNFKNKTNKSFVAQFWSYDTSDMPDGIMWLIIGVYQWGLQIISTDTITQNFTYPIKFNKVLVAVPTAYDFSRDGASNVYTSIRSITTTNIVVSGFVYGNWYKLSHIGYIVIGA